MVPVKPILADHKMRLVGSNCRSVAAPLGKRMGHAGAIITGGKERAEDKIRTLDECGVVVTQSPTRMGAAMQEALKRK